jgi:hypothetical protein
MGTSAIVAIQSAAHTSAARGGILHYLTPGVLDGFAVGVLLTGVILLLLVVPRMRRRSRPDYFAGPVDGDGFGAAAFEDAGKAARRHFEPEAAPESDAYSSDRGYTPHRSKHRMTGPGDADLHTEARPSQPRHAAPSTGFSS